MLETDTALRLAKGGFDGGYIMFEVFKTKNENVVFTYTVDDQGLKLLKDSLTDYTVQHYNSCYLGEFEADMEYLKGVADTLPDNKRVNDITYKVACLRNTLLCSLRVSEEVVSNE